MFVNKIIMEKVKDNKKFTFMFENSTNLCELVEVLTDMRQQCVTALTKAIQLEDKNQSQCEDKPNGEEEAGV